MVDPKIQADDSTLVEMGDRIALLVERVGMRSAVEVTGKSDRQLKRYAAGSEPPFGVLKALIDHANASFDWVASGRARTRVDHELALEDHKRKIPELEKALMTDLSGEGRSDLEELLTTTRQLINLEEQLLSRQAWQADDGHLSASGICDSQSTATLEAGISNSTEFDRTGMISIPRYDEVRPSAGAGSVVVSETPSTRVAFERHWLLDIGVQPSAAVILPAQGDSMAPTIPNGAPMLVDTSKTEVRSGYIYVIAVEDDLLVKRVERRLDGHFDLISDNTAYKTQTIDPARLAHLRVLGRVYAAVNKF